MLKASTLRAAQNDSWQQGRRQKPFRKLSYPELLISRFDCIQEYICNEERDSLIVPLSFQIISSALNTLVVRQRMSELERIFIITELNALILWMPGTRPWYKDMLHAREQALQLPELQPKAPSPVAQCCCYLCYSFYLPKEQKKKPSWWERSMCRSTCHQAWSPKVNSRNHIVEENGLLQAVLWPSHIHHGTCTHTKK